MKNTLPIFLLIFLSACGTEPKAPDTPEVVNYTIEEFYQNTRVSGGNFSDDGSKLLISSDESGIFNAYEINIADGSKKPITSSTDESFFAIDYVPGTNQVLYSADKGGNEIDHIYLLEADGTSKDLTPGEEEKADFLKWSEDKKAFFYGSNKRDAKFFDIYKMSIEDWQAEMIFQNNEGWELGSISPNEEFISLGKAITTSNTKLFLFDNKNKTTTEISTEPGNYASEGFSKDSKQLYYTTDIGKEFSYLVEHEIATGNNKTIFETNWDIRYSYLSETGKYRVIGINEDGKNNLVIKDNSTDQAIDFPKIPDGDISAVSFSDDETQMRLTVGSSKSPSNIYTYNLNSKDLKKLTDTQNKKINPDHLASAEVVRYPSFDDLEIPAIYYKPVNATKDNKAPALVWVHGGPGGQSRVGYRPLIQYLVNNGYAVLAVNNRGSSGYGKTFFTMDDLNHGDKDLKDCIWGKKWLQSQEYIDGDKIGIIGGSYGGYMTMAAMTFAPDEFNVGVNIFGVTNWLRTLKSIPPYWEAFREALYKELGNPHTADSVRLYNISPLFHAHKVKNPVMVLQGANDPRVLQIESDEIVEAIQKNNVQVEYIVFPDEGHGFIKKENEIKGYKAVLNFLETHLKNELKS